MEPQNDSYYIRGQQLASKILADPTYAHIWIPASVMGAPTDQQLGFIDAIFKSDNKDLMNKTSEFVQIARLQGDAGFSWLYRHFMTLRV